MNHNLSIRTESPADYKIVKNLVQAAFASIEYSDQQEHQLVARLRQSDAFIPDLALVAEDAGQILGYILLTRIEIREEEQTHPALALAPVAVLPAAQGQGIGGQLIEAAHERARSLGHQCIVLLGHADYYPRFGYEPCEQYGIKFPFDVPPENCMVLGLQPGSLDLIKGEVVYPPEFG
ncbi:MAG: N-acetyltransferase [Bacteroidota bacterium]